MDRRLLVTGAGGFLGGYVTDHFAGRGWEVLALDRTGKGTGSSRVRREKSDLVSDSLDDLVRSFGPTACVHCAGRSSVESSVEDPLGDFELGPMIVVRLLDTIRREIPKCRFVQLSSAAVYGNPQRIPTGEDVAPAPISPYGWHKWQSEMVSREFSAIYGLPTASVRIFSAYGEGLRRQVVWDVCRKLVSPETPEFFGTGLESRDFIHAKDVCEGIESVLLGGDLKGEVYNLASGEETTIREIIDIAQDILGTARTPTFLGRLPPGVPSRWRAEVDQVRRLGYSPKLTLREGIEGVARDALAWVAANRLPGANEQ